MRLAVEKIRNELTIFCRYDTRLKARVLSVGHFVICDGTAATCNDCDDY